MFGIGNWPELVTAIVNKLGINVLSCASDLCACVILEANKEKLVQLADILIEKEVIFKDDLENIFGKRPFDTIEQGEKAV